MGTLHRFVGKTSPGSSVRRSSMSRKDYGRPLIDSITLANKLQKLALHDPNELRIIEDLVDKRLERKQKGAV